MSFFIPAAESIEHSEAIYLAIAKNINAPLKVKRIFSLSWKHNEHVINAKIGNPMPECFGTRNDVVLAIYDCGEVFKLCSPKRGAIKFSPVIINRTLIEQIEYF